MILNKIKAIVNSIFKKEQKLFPEFVDGENITWIGNSYGGFFVDVSMINNDSTVVSVGIGEDISFDLGISQLGVEKIFMFDPTPKSKNFIDKQQLSSQFKFFEMALSTQDGTMDLYLPVNTDYVSGSLIKNPNINLKDTVKVKTVTIASIIKLISATEIDLLKMDIEGAEYDVLENMIFDNIFPTQICVEFHNRFFKDGDKKFVKVTDLLTANNYLIKGISRTKEEFLFIHQS